MAYCTRADIEKQMPAEKVVELTDDEDTGLVNEARVNEAIAKADALIDSYCGQVESVPFTTVPAVVKQHSITIAIYFLYKRRTMVPDSVRRDYEDALAHLKDIAQGTASLPPTDESDYNQRVHASRTDDDRIMSMGKKSDGSSGTLDSY